MHLHAIVLDIIIVNAIESKIVEGYYNYNSHIIYLSIEPYYTIKPHSFSLSTSNSISGKRKNRY